MVKEISPITCNWYCFCMRFVASQKQWSILKKEIKSKEYGKKLFAELEKTNVKVKPQSILGVLKKEPKKKRVDRLVAFRLDTEKPLNSKEFSKALSPIQKRVVALLKEYGVRDFDATACSEFIFNSKVFNPVGQLFLPAHISLNPELTKRLGEAKLTSFGILFENSPLGLRKAAIDLDEETEALSIAVGSSFKSASVNKIIANAYKHTAEIAKLFVVKKK